jgi:hypothetical protein
VSPIKATHEGNKTLKKVNRMMITGAVLAGSAILVAGSASAAGFHTSSIIGWGSIYSIIGHLFG